MSGQFQQQSGQRTSLATINVAIPSYVRSIPTYVVKIAINYWLITNVAIPSYVRSIPTEPEGEEDEEEVKASQSLLMSGQFQLTDDALDNYGEQYVAIPSYVRSIPTHENHLQIVELESRNPFLCQVNSNWEAATWETATWATASQSLLMSGQFQHEKENYRISLIEMSRNPFLCQVNSNNTQGSNCWMESNVAIPSYVRSIPTNTNRSNKSRGKNVAIPSYVRSIPTENQTSNTTSWPEHVAIPSYVRSIPTTRTPIKCKVIPNVAIPSYVRSIPTCTSTRQNIRPGRMGRNPFLCQVNSNL